jgi:KTSC domain
MAWRGLQSSHMNGSDYDAETQRLTIQFVNGAIYRYHGVPQTTVDTLHQSSSPGTYFHDKIKGNYPEQKLADGMTKSGRRSTRRY